MSKLKYQVIHCSDTKEDHDVTSADIIAWHTNPPHLNGNGWKRPGYNDLIRLDGFLENMVPYDMDDEVDLWEISNGVRGLNGSSRHICLVGGKDVDGDRKNTFSEDQLNTLEVVVKYTLLRHPEIQFLGHYQAPTANGKTCPNFHVTNWLESIGISEANIYRP